MTNGRLLWADDEMELLRAHLLFLEKKGYEVTTVTNGTDAIEECRQHTFDPYHIPRLSWVSVWVTATS